MSTLEIDVGDIRPVAVAFTPDELMMTLADGAKSRRRYPGIRACAMPAQARQHFELMAMGIHWPDLDEDLGIAGMLPRRLVGFLVSALGLRGA